MGASRHVEVATSGDIMSYDERLAKLEHAAKPKVQRTGRGREMMMEVLKLSSVERLPKESLVEAYCRVVCTTPVEFKQLLRTIAGC